MRDKKPHSIYDIRVILGLTYSPIHICMKQLEAAGKVKKAFSVTSIKGGRKDFYILSEDE